MIHTKYDNFIKTLNEDATGEAEPVDAGDAKTKLKNTFNALKSKTKEQMSKNVSIFSKSESTTQKTNNVTVKIDELRDKLNLNKEGDTPPATVDNAPKIKPTDGEKTIAVDPKLASDLANKQAANVQNVKTTKTKTTEPVTKNGEENDKKTQTAQTAQTTQTAQAQV